MRHSRRRPVLPPPGELKGAAVIYLRQGEEHDEADLLTACGLEVSDPIPLNGQDYVVHITLRSNRKVVDVLHPPEQMRDVLSLPLKRIRCAFDKVLPLNCGVGQVDARAELLTVDLQQLELVLSPGRRSETPPAALGDADRPRYLFSRGGEFWKVSFDGRPEFFVKHTLGTVYLDVILHRPNESISALALEMAALDERSKNRLEDAPDQHSDQKSLQRYREALKELSQDRAEAERNNDPGRIEEIDEEVQRIKAQIRLGKRVSSNETRAGDNVRKAIHLVLNRLDRGNKHQKAFAEHIRQYIHTGKDCLYRQPLGRIWG